MLTKEFTGKSVQDAIKNGLEELDIGIDEANIEIISEGSAGLFGIGAKKAVVRITPLDELKIDPDDFEITSHNKTTFDSTVKEFAENAKDKIEDVADELENDIKNFAHNAENKLNDLEEKVESALEKGVEAIDEEIETVMDSSEHVAFITDFLNNLFERMGIECSYDILQKGETLTINISSPDSGKIIGHRGETLDAIQYITRLALNKQDLPYRSVVLQTENYREKREQTLRSLAKRLGGKVERTGRKVTLEPMKSYERRIIHETLQENPNLVTDSYGEEPNRYVVIQLKK